MFGFVCGTYTMPVMSLVVKDGFPVSIVVVVEEDAEGILLSTCVVDI